MMRKRLLAGGLAVLMSALLLVPGLGVSAAAEQPVNAMAPYETFVDPDTFFSGAVLDLKKEGDVHAWITRELENMKYGYNINTLNIYGLEGFDSGDSNENKDFLFEELARLGMKVVVRIEAYSDTFAFQVSDLDYVFNMGIPRSFSSRTYCRQSRLFLENRETDLVMTISIFPLRQSSIIRMKSGRFLAIVPVIPSSA